MKPRSIVNAALSLLILSGSTGALHAQDRILGIDVSYWQTEVTTTEWATLKRPTDQQVNGVYGDGRDFVFIRSSRGGTTGIDKRAGGFPSYDNDDYELSQRYDDPYFVQNITRATAAGLFAGPYHFARPDVVAGTPNSGGIANTGADEADHMIQMAGAWMRPGYLIPVFDLEAGQAQRSATDLATFCIDFSDRIFEVKGVRPIMYINGSYANYVQSAGNRYSLVNAFPVTWYARYANQSDPDSIPVQTGHPKDTYSPIYGPWDDAPRPEHPWHFWQYASTGRLNGNNNKNSNTDLNVAQGGIEFLKDHLVPALWMNNSSGQWTTLANWNSGQTPVAPTPGPGQPTRIGSLTLPPTRLPGGNDTVILDRPDADITVTLASGTHNIRKLYVREALNLAGGTLNVNYKPSWDSTTNAAEFSAPVTLYSGAAFKAHIVQVDPSQTFTWNGGTLRFNTLKLMPTFSTQSKIVMAGIVNFASDSEDNAFPAIVRGEGNGNSGYIDLVGGNRTFNVANGTELTVGVPIANGALTKSGSGNMNIGSANSYSGGTTVTAGRLMVNNTGGSGTGSGPVTVNSGGVLGGTGRISGAVTVQSGGIILAGSVTSIGTLTLESTPTLNGMTYMKISRNGGTTASDRIALPATAINYGGTLMVQLQGDPLVGGEVFQLFSAGSYSGEFSSLQLPSLASGLNWYVGDLAVNGTIRVNRSPVAGGLLTFTNNPAGGLEIPISALLTGGSDPDGNPLALQTISTSTNGIILSTNATSIFYSAGVNVADQFGYTIHDSKGGTANGTVRIVPSSDGTFTQHPVVEDDAVTLSFSGAPGETYFLERSTNFLDWLTISTNVMPSNGVFEFLDPEGVSSSEAVFYRLRWVE